MARYPTLKGFGMGFGGHLVWTAVIRAIKTNQPEKKVVIGQRLRPTLVDRLCGRMPVRPLDSEILYNNPRLTHAHSIRKNDSDTVFIDVEARHSQCFSHCDDERIQYIYDEHMIVTLTRAFGVEHPELRCELYFSTVEQERVRQLAAEIGRPFIVIEPHAKDDFTLNKRWSFERWQAVTDSLSQEWRVVQVGVAGKRLLDGVIDMTGRLTFRETAALIGESRLILVTEGGLMHAANAVKVPAVVVYGGFTWPEFSGYPENENLFSRVKCAPCGLRVECPYGLKCMDDISVEDVLAAARRVLAR